MLGRILLLVATTAVASMGHSLTTYKDPPRCGDWLHYKDEKCFKLAEKVGHQTQKDGEIICEAFSEDLKRESFPKLITIKTQEEQEFLHNLLFVENHFVDNVWLGLKQVGNSSIFKWNDGSEVVYSNWANQTLTDQDHHCVQMSSGKGNNGAGQWVKVHCDKRNDVLCERTQTWTLETLQNIFLSHKLELEREITMLKKNPVPLGFVYVQLPEQQPPTLLWPQLIWTDVTATYAGLFFRAEGGNAAPFGQVQEDSTKRLLQVEHIGNGAHNSPITIPFDGSWSQTIHTGVYFNAPVNFYYGTRFRLSTDEVRPRNQAVKVWQRNQ